MKQFNGLWYPEGDELTKNFRARAETEEFYRADRFHDAMKHVKAWRGAIDCGAHVGHWSVQLAQRFEQVRAIELHPETTRCLGKNLEPYRARAWAINCALGEYVRVANLAARKGTLDSEVTEGGEHEVEAGPLDGLPLDMEHVDYIKVHVNGYELQVLRGAEQTIRRHRPVMTVVIKKALATYGTTEKDIFEFMAQVGYRVASRLKPYWVFAPC